MKTKPELKYLFEADFSDGTTYYQGTDDQSVNHPEDAEGNSPSAYRDVLDRLDEVLRFHLVGAHRYTVDLTDGHFEINGVPFVLERPDVPLTDIKLFYARYVNVESTIEATMQKSGRWGEHEEVGRAHYVSRYAFGFTAMQGGKQAQYVIAVPGDATTMGTS